GKSSGSYQLLLRHRVLLGDLSEKAAIGSNSHFRSCRHLDDSA
ncbi:MAG: hypothetical protein ACI8V0_002930, partial [Pseudohongiellaceae bacterium]